MSVRYKSTSHLFSFIAHEAGSDVPSIPLVHNIAADLSPQRPQPQLRHIRPGLRVPPQEPHRYMHTPPSAREPGLRVPPRNPRRFTHTGGCPPVPLTRHGHSALAGQSQRHTLPAPSAQEGSLRVLHIFETQRTRGRFRCANSPPRPQHRC